MGAEIPRYFAASRMPGDPSVVAHAQTNDAGDDVERDRVRARVKQGLFGGPPDPVRLDQFEILGRLGAGAMGVVYEARDRELDRVVALKLLHPRERQTPGSLLEEARSMARLKHPNVLTVHQVGSHGEQVYVAMERARCTLREWLEQERPPRERVLDVLAATGRGLAALHRQGLVHRDFKPDNVLMDDEGQPRITDFGLALRVDSDVLAGRAGTPAYMAPEQLRGDEVDARSDQFAFGVTAIEALTGKRPFDGDTLDDLLGAILRRASIPGQVPKPIAEVLLRAVEPEASARFSSMDALLERLQIARAERSFKLWWLAAGAAALLVVAVAMATRGEEPTAPPTPTPSALTTASSAPAPIVDVTRLCVDSVKASSAGDAHPAGHAFDGVPSTAWCESAAGDGAGEWIEAKLRPDTWVSEVELGGGWPTTTSGGADLWAINATVRTMRVSWDGGERVVHFDRSTDRGKTKRVAIGAKTSRVRITALEVDRGRFRDLCLQGVVIRGRCGGS